MAHDSQYKDAEPVLNVERFGFPLKGERYWDWKSKRIRIAERNLTTKCPIIRDTGIGGK